MRIGILGVRGIPANYGGFETFVENLAPRLVQRGHEVVVFNRPGHGERMSSFRGVQLQHIPAIYNKYLETLSHTLLAVIRASTMRPRFDVLLVCNVGNSPVVWIPRLRGIPVLLNVDGLEWQRKKWPLPAKWYLKLTEKLAPRMAIHLVTDAYVVQRYYQQHHHVRTTMIPYGAEGNRNMNPDDQTVLRQWGLEPGGYFLYVSRLEPENNADMVLQAFAETRTILPHLRLALVGDAPYAGVYKERLAKMASHDSRVRMPGAIYGSGYAVLQRNAKAYIQATEVGGTHPALVESLAFGNCVLVLNTPENMEVAGSYAVPFETVEELRAQMIAVGTNQVDVAEWGRQAAQYAEATYSWDVITSQYEELLRTLTGTFDSISQESALRGVSR